MLEIEFLIYSSHKTSTQSTLKILRNNKFKCKHCHIISNIDKGFDKNKFLEFLINYKNKNNKKLKIITILRNPIDRLISSFFQCFHNDEVHIKHIKYTNTTIMKNDIKTLFNMFQQLIINNDLPDYSITESIDELSDILDIDLVNNLTYNKDSNTYYTYTDNLIELYVLNFDNLISKNNLLYINTTLGLNLSINGSDNLTTDHIYYKKYLQFKTNIFDKYVLDFINQKYHKVIKLREIFN